MMMTRTDRRERCRPWKGAGKKERKQMKDETQVIIPGNSLRNKSISSSPVCCAIFTRIDSLFLLLHCPGSSHCVPDSSIPPSMPFPSSPLLLAQTSQQGAATSADSRLFSRNLKSTYAFWQGCYWWNDPSVIIGRARVSVSRGLYLCRPAFASSLPLPSTREFIIHRPAFTVIQTNLKWVKCPFKSRRSRLNCVATCMIHDFLFHASTDPFHGRDTAVCIIWCGLLLLMTEAANYLRLIVLVLKRTKKLVYLHSFCMLKLRSIDSMWCSSKHATYV